MVLTSKKVHPLSSDFELREQRNVSAKVLYRSHT